jgi:hypothetical protein
MILELAGAQFKPSTVSFRGGSPPCMCAGQNRGPVGGSSRSSRHQALQSARMATSRGREDTTRPPRNARVAFLCTVFALGFLINSLLGTSVLLLSPSLHTTTLPQPSPYGTDPRDDERRQTESLLLPRTHPVVNSNGERWNSTAASAANFTDRCFYVEDICRSSHRWFYRPAKATKRQPDVLLMKEFEDFRANFVNPSYRQSYRFERNASFLTASQWEECVDSPIENHVRPSRRNCP